MVMGVFNQRVAEMNRDKKTSEVERLRMFDSYINILAEFSRTLATPSRRSFGSACALHAGRLTLKGTMSTPSLTRWSTEMVASYIDLGWYLF